MNTPNARIKTKAFVAITLATGLLAAAVSFGSGAHAATAVPLGTSAQFAVLAGTAVTNTGNTTIQTEDASVRGDVGTSPGNTITGDAFIDWIPPATGTAEHKADGVALQAQADNLTAYNDAAGAPSLPTDPDLAQLNGLTLLAGVHTASSTLNLAVNGTVTLDAENDPAAVFIFQVGSSLTMESGSTVALVNGANPCNIFWQVSEDATIGTNANFVGTLLAENAIVAQSGADFIGRLLAQNAAVTLNNNTFLLPACGDASADDEDDGTDIADADGIDADDADADGADADGADADGADADGTDAADTDTADADTDADGADVDTAGDGADTSAADAGTDGAQADGDASRQDFGLPDTGGPSYGLWIVGIGLILAGVVSMLLGRHPAGAHRRA